MGARRRRRRRRRRLVFVDDFRRGCNFCNFLQVHRVFCVARCV
jgi:hypothetical protein